MNDAQARELQKALELYTAPLLDGFYDDWALRERERLRLLYLNALAHLMRYYQHQREFESSLACGRQILQHDPLREEIHRELMRIYVTSGQRALAVRQYETCREILAAELAIAPMEETQRLYRHIVSGANERVAPPVSRGHANDLPHAVAELHRAIQTFDHAREQLEQAIHHVEQIGTDR
jgi:DNA-binding SARP family transcriptional activator